MQREKDKWPVISLSLPPSPNSSPFSSSDGGAGRRNGRLRESLDPAMRMHKHLGPTKEAHGPPGHRDHLAERPALRVTRGCLSSGPGCWSCTNKTWSERGTRASILCKPHACHSAPPRQAPPQSQHPPYQVPLCKPRPGLHPAPLTRKLQPRPPQAPPSPTPSPTPSPHFAKWLPEQSPKYTTPTLLLCLVPTLRLLKRIPQQGWRVLSG